MSDTVHRSAIAPLRDQIRALKLEVVKWMENEQTQRRRADAREKERDEAERLHEHEYEGRVRAQARIEELLRERTHLCKVKIPAMLSGVQARATTLVAELDKEAERLYALPDSGTIIAGSEAMANGIAWASEQLSDAFGLDEAENSEPRNQEKT